MPTELFVYKIIRSIHWGVVAIWCLLQRLKAFIINFRIWKNIRDRTVKVVLF